MDDRSPSPKGKKFLKLLGRSAIGLAGILAVWIVGGNFIASRQEQKIERDLAAFAEQFPKTEPNDSALKLAALIFSKDRAGVMRKIDNLPVQWQQRLRERDYRESTSTSLQGEALYDFNFWQHFIWKKNAKSEIEELWSSVSESLGMSNSGVFSLMVLYMIPGEDISLKDSISGWTLSNAIFGLKPVMKPYVRFSAIDTYRVRQKSVVTSRQHNICASDAVEIDDVAGWNYRGWPGWGFDRSHLSNQFSKSSKAMLDLELTQKILQVKALAAKEGKWLPSVPDMESSICPGAKWVYGVAPDGTMSIEFSEKPEWLEERLERGGLPFTYSDQTPPKPEKPASTPPQR